MLAKIKKKYNNEYLLTEDKIWVRNFCKSDVRPVDINSISDTNAFLNNEIQNITKNYPKISSESPNHPNVIIVSDGVKFENLDLPKNTTILATNKVLFKWKSTKPIDYYVVNNPYLDCMRYLPNKYFPRCVASSRTYPDFLKQYTGLKFLYCPTPDERYAGPFKDSVYTIDDYRNGICAALVLAYRFRAKKILLLHCDSSFTEERPGSMLLENGYYCYHQHTIADRIIDAMCFWLKNTNISVKNHCFGSNLNYSEYISVENISEFFND